MRIPHGVQFTLLLICLLTAGCVRTVNPSSEAPQGPLLSSIQVYMEAEHVNLVLQITNIGPDAILLHFASGQTFDFVVSDEDDRELWRWSADQMFTQAEQEVVLAARESVRYEAQWNPPARLRGSFLAVGRLVARNHPVEQATRFELR